MKKKLTFSLTNTPHETILVNKKNFLLYIYICEITYLPTLESTKKYAFLKTDFKIADFGSIFVSWSESLSKELPITVGVQDLASRAYFHVSFGNIVLYKGELRLLLYRIFFILQINAKRYYKKARREGVKTNERPGTDHVISGPMRGLKNCTWLRKQTQPQTDMETLWLNLPSGADSVKKIPICIH